MTTQDVSSQRSDVLIVGAGPAGLSLAASLALGAQGVLIGRPWIWALAAGGEVALAGLLARWREELRLAMSLAGVRRVADIDARVLDRFAAAGGRAHGHG